MHTQLAATFAVGVLAAAIAVAGNDDTLTGPQAERAARAAVAAAGGGQATEVDRGTEHGAAVEVEVAKPDGAKVDVLLDVQLRVIDVSPEQDLNDRPANEREPVGADSETSFSGRGARLAAQAAAKAIGGGTLNEIHLGAGGGATWEIEMTKLDLDRVEVLLDDRLHVIGVSRER